jgi:hypothetical protein
MLRGVEGQQPSEIFLEGLRTLIGTKAVRITDWSERVPYDDRTPIGKLFAREGYIAVSIEQATREIQTSLRAQCRTPLSISNTTLLDQLCHDGHLLDENLKKMPPDHDGVKTVRRRIVAGGGQVRVALFSKKLLIPDDGPQDDAGHAP